MILANRIQWRGDAVADKNAIYLFCLLVSAIRLNLLATTDVDEQMLEGSVRFHSEYMYGNLLQICACIALGGYLKGRVVSFGYPRPDKTSFLPAHCKVWQEFGAYNPVSTVPLGAPANENDAGIDLIGWLNFPDKLGSKILVFAQVASGRNWSGKTVIGNAKGLRGWFAGPSFEHFVPMMLMPFNATDARKAVATDPGDMRPHALVWEDREFGILMDRDRVVGSAAAAIANPDLAEDVDNFTEISRVTSWVVTAVGGLRPANA